MNVKNYETVFIITPVLSDQQMRDTADKFKQVLLSNGAELLNEEHWGLRKLAYPIAKKATGYYVLFEFKAAPTLVATLETEFRRDERVIRFLSTVLDKHALEYNAKRRRGEFRKNQETKKEEVAA